MAPREAADPFAAIADGTRRRLLELLRDHERPVSELAENFAISLPAISQHLGILRKAGLVAQRPRGRQRLYRTRPEGLRVVHAWTGQYERFWRGRLDRLGGYLEGEKRRRGRHG